MPKQNGSLHCFEVGEVFAPNFVLPIHFVMNMVIRFTIVGASVSIQGDVRYFCMNVSRKNHFHCGCHSNKCEIFYANMIFTTHNQELHTHILHS